VRRKIKFNRLALLTKTSSAWFKRERKRVPRIERVLVGSARGKKVEPTANFHTALAYFLLRGSFFRVNSWQKRCLRFESIIIIAATGAGKLAAGMLRNSNKPSG
jgi:reverse gyrase